MKGSFLMTALNRSKKVSAALYLCLFLFLLLCNILSPKVSDDFTYHFSFQTKERITNIFQIFPSMTAHATRMNGRLVAHFWAQLFEMLPKGIFNIVNSAIFTLQIFLVHRIGTTSAARRSSVNNALIVAAFCVIWLFQPAFGQVNLWLDGACNYLWAGAFGLVFLLPYVNEFLTGKRIEKTVLMVLFGIFSFLVGAYSENGSAAVIFSAGLLLCATAFFQRKRPALYSILSLVASVLGYITLYLSPAELSKKSTHFSFAVLRGNFVECLNALKEFWLLLAVLVVLLVLAYLCKVETRYMVLALIFTAGAMAANFIMIFASYYERRSAFCVVLLLACAVTILADKLTETGYQPLLGCALAVCLLPTAYHMLVGVNDIYNTYAQITHNEAYIYECKSQNILDIEIPGLQIDTKYSCAYGLKYIDTETSETWPNVSMARYYGVNSIIGK